MYKLSQSRRAQLLLECEFRYSRSSGPGGQKVNKTETQVELRWPVGLSTVFGSDELALIRKKIGHRITQEDVLQLKTDQFRSRSANQRFNEKHLIELIEKALTPVKVRRATRPTRAAVHQRLEGKRQRSETKKNRKKFNSSVDS